jgi:LPS-assembly protein
MNNIRFAGILILLTLSPYLKANNDTDYITIINDSSAESCMAYNSEYVMEPNEGINIEADSLSFSEDSAINLNNNVQIDFPGGSLQSSNALIGKNKDLIEFADNAELSLENFYLQGQKGSFTRSRNDIAIQDGSIFLPYRGLKVSFDELSGSLDNKLQFKAAKISSCMNYSDGWLIRANEVGLDNKTFRGYAKNITLEIKGISVFKSPYMPFATTDERLSGFLEPTLSSSSDGIDFSVPYFAVLSDHSDITIAARNIAKRGSGVELNYRYIKSHTKNNFDALYFDDDKEMQKNFPQQADSRWAYKIQDSLMLNRASGVNWGEVNVNYSKASDAMVLRDITGEITSIGGQRDHYLNQNVIVSSYYKNLTIDIEHQGFQSLNPLLSNGYKKSPSIELNFRKSFKSLVIKHKLNIANFKTTGLHEFYGTATEMGKYLSIVDEPVEGARTYSDLSFSKRYMKSMFNIKASVGLKSLSYDLNNYELVNNDIHSPNAEIDISSIFVKKNEDGFSSIQPRLLVGFSKYKDQTGNPVFDSDAMSYINQVFQNNRFSGMDRISDEFSNSIGFVYRINKLNRNVFKFNFAKKYTHSDNKVYLSNPNIVNPHKNKFIMSSMWMPNMNNSLRVYGGFDSKNDKLHTGGINLLTRSSIGTFGFAKRYRRMAGNFKQTLDYSEIYTSINIRDGFKIIGKFQHDDKYDVKIESMIGVEYENCCIALRLIGSDKNLTKYNDLYNTNYTYLNDAWDNMINIENKSRINFEFELKGFSASVNKIDRMLQDSMLNY